MKMETTLLVFAAASSCVLGGLVLFRNPFKHTHRLFALLSLNLPLWALGVLCIIHSTDEAAARFWLRATFMVAGFLPVTFYHFVVYFPNQRFDGILPVLLLLYTWAIAQLFLTFTPWYIQHLYVSADAPPQVIYGPIFKTYGLFVLLSISCIIANLVAKVSRANGVERRQIQHLLLGIGLCTTLSAATNVLAPLAGVASTEAYGPVFSFLMMAVFAYAMVRYHLMDIWVLISRTTIYASITVFVTGVFIGTVFLVRWMLSGGSSAARELVSAVAAAVVIVLVLQPIKERLQILVDRAVLKVHYDVGAVCAMITEHVSQFMRLEELLTKVSEDLQVSLGARHVRVWLVDEKEPNTLSLEYASDIEKGTITCEHGPLLDYVRGNQAPILLKQLEHERPTVLRTTIAGHLIQLDAMLCVPMCVGRRVLGLVILGDKESRDMYSMDDLAVLKTIAGPLGTAIENSRLYVKIEEVNLHLARILSSMRGGVVAVDQAGAIKTINASATEIFGALPTGRHYSALSAPLDRVFQQCLTEGRGVGDFETAVTSPSGETISVAISASCLETPDGGQCGAVAMIHDLTQIKRLEQNVQRADRLSSIGMLAAGMAHEIKNPLVSVKTFTQLLLTKFDDEDFRTTFADVVPHEVDRIDTIVSRLLDFARPKPVMFAQQDIIQVIEETLALIANQARKFNITIKRDYTDESIPVYGDEQQLHQVFLNLFLNAMDAMKAHGSGTLKVAAHYDHRRFHNHEEDAFTESECVRIVISDTGCGIAQEHIEYLFTPFFTTKVEGCGLGLSVVHGIVMEHRGEIDVESVPGSGSSFSITFPFAKDLVAVGAIPEAAISITQCTQLSVKVEADEPKPWKAAK